VKLQPVLQTRVPKDLLLIESREVATIPVDKKDAALSPGDFQELFARYYPGICRQLTTVLGDAAMAEDLAQETFLKLFRSPPRDMSNIGGWLYKVALNLAYKHLRKEENRRRRELRASTDPAAGLNNHLSFYHLQEIREVKEILKTLPVRDRLCLMLKFSGYSYKEIAGVIGVDVKSVGTIVARARVRFRKAYDSRGGTLSVLR